MHTKYFIFYVVEIYLVNLLAQIFDLFLRYECRRMLFASMDLQSNKFYSLNY